MGSEAVVSGTGVNPSQSISGVGDGGLTKRTLRGFKWTYLSFFLQSVLQLGVLFVLARVLSPRDFGLVGITLIFTSLTERVGQVGIGPALVQRAEITEAHLRTGSSLSLLIGLLFFTVLWFAAPFAAEFFAEPELTALLHFVSISFVIESLGMVPQSVLQRELRFKAVMLAENLSYFLGQGVVAYTLAIYGFGPWALATGIVATRLVKTVTLLSFAPHWPTLRIRRQESKELLNTGLGFSLTRILNYCALQGDNFVVGRLVGATGLGLYTRAYQLMTIPANYFGRVLDRVLFPAMAQRQQERARLTGAFLLATEIVALVGMPMSVFMYGAAPEIVLVLFGKQWEAVIPVFQILSIGVFCRTSYKNCDTLARALGKVYRHASRQLLYTALVVGGALIGGRWGLEGVAWAVLFAVTVNYVVMSLFSLVLLELPWQRLVAAHGPAVWVSLLLAAVLFPFLSLLREAGLPPLAIVAAAGLAAAAVCSLALVVAPPHFRITFAPWVLKHFPLNKFGRLGHVSAYLLTRIAARNN